MVRPHSKQIALRCRVEDGLWGPSDTRQASTRPESGSGSDTRGSRGCDEMKLGRVEIPAAFRRRSQQAVLTGWMLGKRDRGPGGTASVLARAPEGRGCCVWRRGDFRGAVGELGCNRDFGLG